MKHQEKLNILLVYFLLEFLREYVQISKLNNIIHQTKFYTNTRTNMIMADIISANETQIHIYYYVKQKHPVTLVIYDF